MSRRARDRRAVDLGHGSPSARERFRHERHLGDVLRRLQLAAAGVMLSGLTTSTLVCAGEFRLPWLIAAGGGVFVLGLAFFGVARPLARWWTGQ